jgi:putative ABC transport system ATP-binding protein
VAVEAPDLVELQRVSRFFGSEALAALDEVDLLVRRGDFLAVVGPSGCGKTTLLHLLGALDRPDAGEALYHGAALRGEKEASAFRRESVGFLFQSGRLWPTLTAWENVQIPLLEGKTSARERAERAADLLHEVGLGQRLHHFPAQLSGGEKQRVAAARSLVAGPALLLADEPTGQLDRRTGGQLLELMQRLHAERHMALVIVTHDETVAERARRIVRMEDGRILQEGGSRE